jgi:2-polyprenyl-6-hydroxyphenyl methylase/3-demethylubiquinone-9 3-methyltransferase
MQQLHKMARLTPQDVVLDVGCGNGHHLFHIAPFIHYGIGVDFSRNMIESARKALKNSPYATRLQFQPDNAHELHTVNDQSVDLVMCVGAFEHMLEKAEVLRQIYRVLKPGGRLVLMTLNGNYIWYRFIAPLFRYPTRHLSTDYFLSAVQLKAKFTEARFIRQQIHYWTFIPRGDMSKLWGSFLKILDFGGWFMKIPQFRGGIIARADKS